MTIRFSKSYTHMLIKISIYAKWVWLASIIKDLIFKNYHIFIYSVCVHGTGCAHMEVKGQLLKVGFLLPARGAWE